MSKVDKNSPMKSKLEQIVEMEENQGEEEDEDSEGVQQ
jgi:hypothetical protein